MESLEIKEEKCILLLLLLPPLFLLLSLVLALAHALHQKLKLLVLVRETWRRETEKTKTNIYVRICYADNFLLITNEA